MKPVYIMENSEQYIIKDTNYETCSSYSKSKYNLTFNTKGQYVIYVADSNIVAYAVSINNVIYENLSVK